MSIHRPSDQEFDQFRELEDDLATLSEARVIKILAFLLVFFGIFRPERKAMKTNTM